jgi:Uma2 family endonuclease
MSSDAVSAMRPGPYTPADLAATPDDGQRYELIDGALLVSWSRTLLHQRAAGRLCNLLNAAGASELEAVGAIEVRCGPDTVLVPDVVMLLSSVVDEPDCVVMADHVVLVAEVASPSTVRMDRVLRPRLYADAGIPAYLLVELEEPTVTWFSLPGPAAYQRCRVVAGDAELLVTVKPFEMRIVPAELVRRARRQQ